MDKIAGLKEILALDPKSSFARYGIAMELKKSGDSGGALKFLDQVTQLDVGHGCAFFQRGQIFESTGDVAGAGKAYENGIFAAQKSGDGHALSELLGALDQL